MNEKMGEIYQDEGKIENNAQMVGRIDEWVCGQVSRWKDEWADRRMDAQMMMDRWMDLGCRVNI